MIRKQKWWLSTDINRGYRSSRHFFSPRNRLEPEKINPLTPNDRYSGRTAPLTSKRCILYIFSTNTGTKYFKHGIYSPFFSSSNAVSFIILTYLVPVLFTFYIQSVLKLKKNSSGTKTLSKIQRDLCPQTRYIFFPITRYKIRLAHRKYKFRICKALIRPLLS